MPVQSYTRAVMARQAVSGVEVDVEGQVQGIFGGG
jgi:hypothetical protein